MQVNVRFILMIKHEQDYGLRQSGIKRIILTMRQITFIPFVCSNTIARCKKRM